MSLVLRSLHPKVNVDKSWDTRYPNGDKPQVAPSSLGINLTSFNAANINLVGLPANVAVSINYRTYLTGTSASTATISVNAITGSINAWAMDSGTDTNLTNPATNPGSGTLQVVATDGITTVTFPVQAWSVLAIVQSHTIKFNPGAYIYLDRNTSWDQQIARTAAYVPHTSVAGFQVITFWAQWENPNVPGDYSGGWDTSGNSGFKGMDKMLAALSAYSRPMRLMWHLSTYGFAGSNQPASFPSNFMPTYLGGATYGPNTPATNGIVGGAWVNAYNSGVNVASYARYWTAPVMGRLIALIQAYGARYNSHPLFEMASFIGESTTPLTTGYTDDSAFAQLSGANNYFQASRTAWPNTQLRFWGNYLQDPSKCKEFIDAAVASFFTLGGPDCVNETGSNTRIFPFNLAYRGINPVTGVLDNTYTNYVGKGCYVSEFEPDEEMPRSGAAGPATFGDNNWSDYINFSANLQLSSYTTWFDNTYGGNNDKRFGGYLTSQPTHPNAIDYIDSLYNGGTVNGATAGTTVTNRTYPSLWP